MIFTKILITNFREKMQKLSLMFFRKIQMLKTVRKKPKSMPFWYIKLALFKISNPDSLRVKAVFPELISKFMYNSNSIKNLIRE